MCSRSLVVFSFSCVVLCAFTSATNWTQMKTKHYWRNLTGQQLTKLVSNNHDMDLFKSLLGPILVPRIPDTPGSADVRRFIVNDLTELGWNVTKNQFEDMTPYDRKNFTNIIAVKNPQARRWLTLACHYDSKMLKGEVFLAATDSAVPCAMMLHLAHKLNDALNAADADSELTLQLLFLDGEEAFKEWTDTDSLYGARHLAKMWADTPYQTEQPGTTQLDRIDLFILLDLIGAPNPRFHNWFRDTSRHYSRMADIEQERLVKLKRRLARNGDQAEIMKPYRQFYFSRSVYNSGPHIQDDHIPFLRRNVPVIHLISEPFPRVWHTPHDDEAHLDYDTIQNLNSILRVFVYEYLHL